MTSVLNRDLLADNACFGCGGENPRGLQIEIRREPGNDSILTARFLPTEQMGGFPGITHGGAVYTAMDCLSTWVAILLGPNRGAAWLLRSATVTYHKPAHTGQPITFVASVKKKGGAWDPLTVHVEARRQDELLCAEADFKVVPVAPDKLCEIAGITQLPENWAAFLSGGV